MGTRPSKAGTDFTSVVDSLIVPPARDQEEAPAGGHPPLAVAADVVALILLLSGLYFLYRTLVGPQ